MKRLLVCLAATSLLSGCLLDQTDPAPTTQPKTPYLGYITVEDMTISNQARYASFNGRFEKKAQEKSKPVGAALATFYGREQAVLDLQGPESSRGPICEKNTYVKAPADSQQQQQKPADFLNIGSLAFGPALQSTFMILQADNDNRNFYQAALEPNIPAGAYMLLTDGTQNYAAFRDYLSMPEQVTTLRLDGKNFGDPTYKFQPSKGLTLFWKEPAIANDQNGILLEIQAEDEDYVYDVFCAIAEENILGNEGYKEWSLPANWFNEFPTTGKANFYFLRSHLYMPEYKDGTKIAFQGRRTFYAHLNVQ